MIDLYRPPATTEELKKSVEPKKSENELHWEELVKNMTRPLTLCDLDFTDLTIDDENDVLATRSIGGSVPPPPPPIGMPAMTGMIPPPCNLLPPPTNLVPPPFSNIPNGPPPPQANTDVNGTSTIKKNKKTVSNIRNIGCHVVDTI